MTTFDINTHVAEKCAHCHLFIDWEDGATSIHPDGTETPGAWLHLHRDDEADQAIDATHNAEPSGLKAAIAAWKVYGPAQMRERFIPADFDRIKDEPRQDAVGVALLAGVPWERARHHSYEVQRLMESVIEADMAAHGDSNDSEISWLSGSLEEALSRWPDLEALRADIDPDVPLSEATGDLQDLLVRLAEKHKDHPDRPCCDGDTTLRDWIDAGISRVIF